MISWRLNWTLNELFSIDNYSKHKQTLTSSSVFWLALAVKFFPTLWKRPILLRLKEGGAFYVREFMSLYIYKEIFVDKCYDYPVLTVEEPAIMDIGGNTGLFTLRMKQLYPDATIYSFEPFASNYQQLSKTIEVSKLNKVTAFPFGIGGTTRTERLYIHKNNVGGHSIMRSETNSDAYTEIELVSISEMFQRLNLTKCHLLKMDCEGAEYEIIKKLDHELASKIEKIVFEPTPTAYEVNEITEHLKNIGFYMVDRDGLCVAINRGLENLQSSRLTMMED
ncbi:FkbM family methyltransferase [Daejeonella sp.]|uniref:FkbM family methyltransferase n=1 Tax=Daejeonella sp. TaxID=2805397 RepID=UPI00398382C5